MEIILPIYYTIEYKRKKNKTILIWLNWYRNAHFILSNNVKHYYHNLVKEQITWEVFEWQYTIDYKVYLRNKATDWPNVKSILEKFALDWLVECWVLKDDKVTYFKWWSFEYYIDKDNPRFEMKINRLE